MNASVPTIYQFPKIALLASLTLLAGCGEELLMMNYVVMPANPQFTAAVGRGTSSVTDVFGSATCVLTVDTGARSLTTHKNGNLGQPGYNIAVSTVNPVNAVTTNPASCPAIESLAINVGNQSDALDIGSETTSTGLDATVNATAFASADGGYFSAKITGQNQMEGTVSGSFESISNSSSNPRMMIVTQGSFKVK